MTGALSKAWLLMCLALLAPLSGCLGPAEEGPGSNPITMSVHYDVTAGTIEEVIRNGQLISQSGVDLSFDFSRVASNSAAMKTFTMDPGDDEEGANAITVNSNENTKISYTYLTHGLFVANLSALDENGNTASMTVTVRIDKTIAWTETNTGVPEPMPILVTPDCQCNLPERIGIDSIITNLNTPITGNQVTVTWHLNNPDGTEEASHTEQAADGQDASWDHEEFHLMDGTWSLEVTIDVGNDNIDVDHTVMVQYETLESEPNPFISEEA